MVTLLPLPDYYATMSDGTHIENPRYYRTGQAVLARRQQSMEHKRKGSGKRANHGLRTTFMQSSSLSRNIL